MESPIFVVGVPRSGTTLLRLMLNKHSNIAIPEETWFFVKLEQEKEVLLKGDWRRNVSNRIMELSKVYFPDLNISEIDKILSKLNIEDWPSIVASLNISFAHQEGKKRWGDKTPGYVIRLPLIKKLYPNAKIIHITRDGRDVVSSILKHWNVGPQTDSYIETILYWKRYITKGIKEGPELFGDNYMELKYEDLIQTPQLKLTEVCSFIGEDFEENMINTSENSSKYVPKWEWHENTQKPLQQDHIALWKKKYKNYELFLFELCAGKVSRKLNYEPSTVFNWKALYDYCSFQLIKFTNDIILKVKLIVFHSLVRLKLK